LVGATEVQGTFGSHVEYEMQSRLHDGGLIAARPILASRPPSVILLQERSSSRRAASLPSRSSCRPAATRPTAPLTACPQCPPRPPQELRGVAASSSAPVAASGAALSELNGWSNRLLLEKRNMGARSRSEAVVTGRRQLLQRMMTELAAFPELATAPAMRQFCCSGPAGVLRRTVG